MGSTSKGRTPIVLVATIFVVAGLAMALVFLPVKEGLAGFPEWAQGLGSLGPALLAAAYALACVLFIPGSLLTLGAGFAFGFWWGFLAVVAGSNAGAWLAFWLGRTALRNWVAGKVGENPRFAALDEAVAREGLKMVILTRLSPVLPFNVLNYAFGLTRVRFRDYALGSALGMLPGTAMYVSLGTAAGSLAEIASGKAVGGTGPKILLALGLLATIAVTILITRLARRALRQTEASGEPSPDRSAPAPASAETPAGPIFEPPRRSDA